DRYADPGHLGRARFLPRLGARRARPGRRSQTRARRAPPRRLPLGPSRSSRPRQSAAHRLLRLSTGAVTAGSTDTTAPVAVVRAAFADASSWGGRGRLEGVLNSALVTRR